MKKSYMNYSNLIKESFFKKLTNIFKSAKTKPKKTTVYKKDMDNTLNSLDQSISDLEKSFEDLYGKKFNFKRMTHDDIKKDLR